MIQNSFFNHLQYNNYLLRHPCISRMVFFNHVISRNVGHAVKVVEALTKNKAVQDITVKALSEKVISNSQTSTVSLPNDQSNTYSSAQKVIGFFDRVIPKPGYKSHVLTQESTHVLQGKQALLRFCDYFRSVPLDQLEKDPVFILYIKQLSEKDSTIYTRAFQLALEGVYSKRYFSEIDITKIFQGNLSIMDIVGTNHLTNQPGFKNNTELRVVVSTCIKSDNLKHITNPSIRQFIQDSQAATGNTLNDIVIDGHHYDFKITPDVPYRKNHIIFLDYQEINVNIKGRQYLDRLHKDFQVIMKENSQNPYMNIL